jgi:hypothetical protein
VRILALGWQLEGPGVERAELFSAESLASYDAVLLDPKGIPRLWEGQARLEGDGAWRLYPGQDLGLSRALERLFSLRREELSDLLQRGGGLLVVRVRPEGSAVEIAGHPPRRITPYSLLPRLSLVADPHHLSLPQGLRFVPRRGRDISWLEPAHPLAPYLEAFLSAGYEAVLVSSLGAPLSAFGRVLAKNRVGDALAWDLPVGTGRILFLPSFPGADPRRAGEILIPALAELLERPLPEGGPDWLSNYPLPGEEELLSKREELEVRRRELKKEEEKLARELGRISGLRGLLYPRGLVGLRAAVELALEELGCRVAKEGDRFLSARAGKRELLLRPALSPSGPVGPEPYRELLLALDRLKNEEGREAHGVLVAVAEPRLDPKRRGPQWAEAVRRGCAEHGITLVSGYQLFRGVVAAREGDRAEEVLEALFETEGEWRWKP